MIIFRDASVFLDFDELRTSFGVLGESFALEFKVLYIQYGVLLTHRLDLRTSTRRQLSAAGPLAALHLLAHR